MSSDAVQPIPIPIPSSIHGPRPPCAGRDACARGAARSPVVVPVLLDGARCGGGLPAANFFTGLVASERQPHAEAA